MYVHTNIHTYIHRMEFVHHIIQQCYTKKEKEKKKEEKPQPESLARLLLANFTKSSIRNKINGKSTMHTQRFCGDGDGGNGDTVDGCH